MNNLTDFISERLKLTKEINNELTDYYIIWPIGYLYQKCKTEFKDFMIQHPHKADIFILNINDIIDNFKKVINSEDLNSDSDDLKAYKIPEKYNDFKELKKDYLDDKFGINDLETFDLSKYK